MSQATTTVPLSQDQAGVLRVTGTRVSLDSVIFVFNEGATPEEIVQQYPTLDLKDVYAVISYYLQNLAEVESYLAQRQVERKEIKKEIESRFDPHGIRERLMSRKQP
jgi:uncharacterized protein (DUF433 family)